MRTISKKTQYGLKAMQALGRRYREGPVLICTLAREESIPLKFLEVILLDLKSHGLLESKLGRKGGYRQGQVSRLVVGSFGCPSACRNYMFVGSTATKKPPREQL